MLEETINRLNEWWKTGAVPKPQLGNYYRDFFFKLQSILSKEKKIIGLVGLRQVGKTIILFQIIDSLIKQGINAKNILYLNFDSPKLRLEAKNLDKCLRYFETIVGKPLEATKTDVFIFLDEIQKLEDWANQVKYWQDLKKNIKFVISGSSSLNIIKGIGESLVGRINYFILLPLSFNEICRINHDIKAEKIKTSSLKELSFKDFQEIFEKLKFKKREMELGLKDYLIKGGFPDIQNKNVGEAFEKLTEYRTLIFKRDLLDMIELRDSRKMDDLLTLVAFSVGSEISYEKIASSLSITLEKVEKYVNLFEEAFLVKIVYLFKKPYVSKRKSRKIFFTDTGMLNSTLERIDFTDTSDLIENAVLISILRRMYEFLIDPKIYYQRTKKEVDFIAKIQGKIIPIEVKYKEDIKEKDITELIKFMMENKIEKGIIITKDLFKEEKIEDKTILYVPAWLFLLSF